ncbi:hypothetical protein [Brucella sp. 2280]|uniref:hypothetical protein n=1 Tax=Brucella sp. 2280 TaxID=2592625 RepID=UPI001294D5C7|nr:hypothetical protein [Brucella sp. 2280]QGA57253.1 hypothetical protein GHC20_09270 [Brucella sp. 2280]
MTLDEILDNVADQDRGRECELTDPVTGEPTGIKLLVVGPDSKTAHDARIAMTDELMEMTRHDGTVSGEDRERARLNCLARLIVRWEQPDGMGNFITLSHANILKLLRVSWVEAQIDAFASNRAHFREVA